MSYHEDMRRRLSKMPVVRPAAPWKPLAPVAIGGLTEGGYLPDSDDFLAITSAGRGLFDGTTGENSELDYRDQRNLSIELTREVSEQLTHLFKQDPRVFFKGKLIRVQGTAQRVKIRFTFQDVVTDKFYYQTHVRVRDASQITVLD